MRKIMKTHKIKRPALFEKAAKAPHYNVCRKYTHGYLFLEKYIEAVLLYTWRR